MALPYPSMSFVPLDVLSADELNQMVANDQYLAGLFPVQGSNIDSGAVDTAQIADGAVTNAKTDFTGTLNLTGTSTMAVYEAKNTGANVAARFGVDGDGINHGFYSTKLGKWIMYCDNTKPTLTSDTRLLGGWYLAGKTKVTGTTTATVTLPVANPHGLQVFASCELYSSGSWVDIRALDSSNNAVAHNRNFIQMNSGGTVTGSGKQSGSPFAVMPAGTNMCSTCVATSVRSNANNYRTWNFQSFGGNFEAWAGGSRQDNNTSIAKIQVVAAANSNIYLEVWALDA